MAIHPTAIISKDAIIDPTVEIGPYSIVEENVKIGQNTKLWNNVFIGAGTTLGCDNEIHMGAVLGHVPQDKKYKGETSYVRIGDKNIIREYVTVHRGASEGSVTSIGNECLIMGGCHIAHNCIVGNQIIMANMAAMAGHVEVADRVFISGGAMIHQFVTVGKLAILAGNSRFSMDVPPFVIAAERNQVWGINVIGLRRAGFPTEKINEIKELFRMFFFDFSPRTEVLEKIRKHPFHAPEVQEFIAFVENSKRGICRAHKESDGE